MAEMKDSKGTLNSLGAYRMGIFWKLHIILHSRRLEVRL